MNYAQQKLEQAVALLEPASPDARRSLYWVALKMAEIDANGHLDHIPRVLQPEYREIMQGFMTVDVPTGQFDASINIMTEEQVAAVAQRIRRLCVDVRRLLVS